MLQFSWSEGRLQQWEVVENIDCGGTQLLHGEIQTSFFYSELEGLRDPPPHPSSPNTSSSRDTPHVTPPPAKCHLSNWLTRSSGLPGSQELPPHGPVSRIVRLLPALSPQLILQGRHTLIQNYFI